MERYPRTAGKLETDVGAPNLLGQVHQSSREQGEALKRNSGGSTMRRLVVAAVVVGLALAVTGCSSSSSDSSASTAPAAAPAAAPVPVAAGASTLPNVANRSENETTTFEPFPANGDIPADLHQKITVDKQPTLIYFYDSTQQTSKEVRVIIDTIRNRDRGMVDLVAYDIGKYVTTNADGSVDITDTLATDTAAKAAVMLARDSAINVTFTPFIVLTDGQGYIIFKHRGLIDEASLEHEVLRASR